MTVRKVFVKMSDGIRLYTYIYLPGDGKEKYYTIFRRDPYLPAPENAVEETLTEDDGEFVSAGFAVVVQRCRGKGGSEGECIPFHNERRDGLETLSWISSQPFFNGTVYLSGTSYNSFVHLSYMDSAPDFVKGAYLSVMPSDGSKAMFTNGIMKADLYPLWFLCMYHSDELKGKDTSSLYSEFQKFPKCDYPKRVYGYDIDEFRYLSSMRLNPRGTPGSFSDAVDSMRKCTFPVLLYDGWGEMFLEGMVQMWDELPDNIRKKSAFIMGPWSHDGVLHSSWKYEFPDGNCKVNNELEWFLHLRDGKEMNEIREGKVRYYNIGKNVWEYSDMFPKGINKKTYYLSCNSRLTFDKPEKGSITYTYDPENAPSFPGGPNTFITGPVGFAYQPEINFRPDVISFVSEPASEEYTVKGRASVTLQISSSSHATAFVIRLSVIDNNGNTTIMQDSPSETPMLFEGEKFLLSSHTGPMCLTVRKGEKIRVDISSADKHSYMLHSNIPGDQYYVNRSIKADNTVYFGLSRIELPID